MSLILGKLGCLGCLGTIGGSGTVSSPYQLPDVRAIYDLARWSEVLYQDLAGTVPVTAMEQPVGMIKDTSGRGAHLVAPTTLRRGTVSARVNLLQKTEQLNESPWGVTGTTVTSGYADPFGGARATRITAWSTGYKAVWQLLNPVTATQAYKISVYAKAASTGRLSLEWRGSGAAPTAVFDLSAGGLVSGAGTIDAVPGSAGWYRCTITGTAVDTSEIVLIGFSGEATQLGDSVYIYGPDARPVDQSTGLLPAYQRVNAGADYDVAGFPVYVKGDSVAQVTYTTALSIGGTTALTVWYGFRKSITPDRVVITTGASVLPYLFVDETASAAIVDSSQAMFLSVNNSAVEKQYVGRVSFACKSSPSIKAYANKVLLGVITDATTVDGSFANTTMYLLSGNGQYGYSKGNLYSLVVAGKVYDDKTTAAIDAWVNQRTKSY